MQRCLIDRKWLQSAVFAAFVCGCAGSLFSQVRPPVTFPPLAQLPASAGPQPVQPPNPAVPSTTPNVEAITPGVAVGADANQPPSAGIFQGKLPPDLMFTPPTVQVKQAYQKYIPRTIDPENVLDLLVGQPRILSFAEFAVRPKLKIYLPDNRVARWDVLSETEIAIVGNSPGSTTLTIWVNDPEAPNSRRVLSYLVRVYEDPQVRQSVDQLEQQINDEFPDSMVRLSMIGNRLVIRGQAKDAIEASQILQIVAQTRNRRRVTTVSETTINESSVFIDRDRLLDDENASLRRSIVDPTQLARLGVINLLRIPGEQQVMLRVTVAEVNRNAARSIGLNFSATNNGGVQIFSQNTANLAGIAGVAGNTLTNGVVNMTALLDNGQIPLAIHALRTLNLSRTLAEPNLTTLNGRPARFQAGGRFPVPVVATGTGGGNNLQGVQFVPFGVQLEFTPFIVDRDRVRLQISAEVSTRDESLGTNVGGSAGAGGTSVSGLNTRNFENTVELREGQTLAVAGLIQNNFGSSSDRIPLWGDLPLLGATGGYHRTSSNEQELVILVTPELVHPLEANETPPVPGADVFEPTDIEFYLGNRLESHRSRNYRATVRTDYHKLRRVEKACEDIFIIGTGGQTYGCPQIVELPSTSVPQQAPEELEIPAEVVSPPGAVIQPADAR
ncbi:MAG TPA: secretion system protein [Planctomycetaceae bacterium]|nr:secretion system protein [Planctomycetaceae bacterium]